MALRFDGEVYVGRLLEEQLQDLERR